jgi:hypothetical protein
LATTRQWLTMTLSVKCTRYSLTLPSTWATLQNDGNGVLPLCWKRKRALFW